MNRSICVRSALSVSLSRLSADALGWTQARRLLSKPGQRRLIFRQQGRLRPEAQVGVQQQTRGTAAPPSSVIAISRSSWTPRTSGRNSCSSAAASAARLPISNGIRQSRSWACRTCPVSRSVSKPVIAAPSSSTSASSWPHISESLAAMRCAATCSSTASRRELLMRTHASPRPHASAPDAAIVAPAIAWLCPAICSVN